MSDDSPRPVIRAALTPWGRILLLGLFLGGCACLVAVTGVDGALDSRPGVWAGALYVLLYALGALAFVPKTALSAAAGALFGAGPGLLVAVAGTTLGALLGFAAGRLLGRDALRPLLLRSGALTKLDERLSGRAGRAFTGVLLLRVLPVVPFAAVNLGVALSRMRWTPFAFGTLVGTIPGNVTWVLAGASAATPSSPGLLIPAVVGVALLGVLPAWRLVRRRRRRMRLT